MKIKRAFVFGIGAACAVFSRPAFAEDKSAGFYAGPLSVVAATVVEVKAKKPVFDKKHPLAAEESDFAEKGASEKFVGQAAKRSAGLHRGSIRE